MQTDARKDWEAAVKDMNNKFDVMLADSNAKFDKLFAKLEHQSEASALKIESNYEKVQTSIANAKLQIVMWFIATALTMGGIAYKIWPPTEPDHSALASNTAHERASEATSPTKKPADTSPATP